MSILEASEQLEEEISGLIDRRSGKARVLALERARQFLEYEIQHRDCAQIDQDALNEAVRIFRDELQLKYNLFGEDADINEPAKEFQRMLDEACKCKAESSGGTCPSLPGPKA